MLPPAGTTGKLTIRAYIDSSRVAIEMKVALTSILFD